MRNEVFVMKMDQRALVKYVLILLFILILERRNYMGLIPNQRVWDANSKKWKEVKELKLQSNLTIECQCDFCGKRKFINNKL